jgi:hypothetical protein
LQELITSTVTNKTKRKTAIFFIRWTLLIHYKNKLFLIKTIFVPILYLKKDKLFDQYTFLVLKKLTDIRANGSMRG